jgi:molecular chaperone GrpE
VVGVASSEGGVLTYGALQDKFTRVVADFRNLQDRTERDKKSAKDFAIQKFAKDLIESVDNLERALQAVPEDALAAPEQNKELVDFYNGLKMTEDILLSTLKKHGLEKINPMGDAFDPNVHEATFQAPMPDKEPGTVFHVQQTGFLLNGRTIRVSSPRALQLQVPQRVLC